MGAESDIVANMQDGCVNSFAKQNKFSRNHQAVFSTREFDTVSVLLNWEVCPRMGSGIIHKGHIRPLLLSPAQRMDQVEVGFGRKMVRSRPGCYIKCSLVWVTP
jgi:hypothetical protein